MSLAVQKLLSFMKSYLVVDLRAYNICVLFVMVSPVPMRSRLCSHFFSIKLSMSGIMRRSLSHLYLSFEQGDNYGAFLHSSTYGHPV